jgi:hypothetical protein
MALLPVPIPATDPIARPPRQQFVDKKQVDPQQGLITEPWVKFFSAQSQSVSQAPTRIQAISLTGQFSNIAASDLTAGGGAAGLYRLTYYMRITRAATLNSNLTFTAGWTDDGVPQSISGAGVTGNTTTSLETGTVLIYSDPISPITYATTYVSAGATAMNYKLSVTLEQIAA